MADSFVSGQAFAARDGQSLSYYVRGDNPDHLIILLHGSTCHGGYYESLALELADQATVCVPTIRGHHNSGDMRGSCSYIGQLEDDIVDLIAHLGGTYKKITLLGHSSGGGLALRFAQGKYCNYVHNYILLAPAIPSRSVMKRKSKPAGRIQISWGKIICLKILNMIGITSFNKSTVIRFTIPQERLDGSQTTSYDFNLLMSLHPNIPFSYDANKLKGTLVVLIGGQDDRLNPNGYKAFFADEKVVIMPNVGHKDICRLPEAIAEIKKHLIF